MRRALLGALAALTLFPGTADARRMLCDVPVTMSDGTNLSATVWLPDAAARSPTVLTQDSQKPVPPGEPQLYRIEVYATDAVFKAGHRIRFSLGSAATPSATAPLPNIADQLGGELRVLRGGRYGSHVLLPVR